MSEKEEINQQNTQRESSESEAKNEEREVTTEREEIKETNAHQEECFLHSTRFDKDVWNNWFWLLQYEPPILVVLDLDETLVCAYETSSLPAALRTRAVEAGLTCFELECVCSELKESDGNLKLKESDGNLKVSHVTVFEHPGLHQFLKRIGEFADIVLFTVGLEGVHAISNFMT